MILNMPKGALLSIDLNQQECLVECRKGCLWITRTGDSRDSFLRSGHKRSFSGEGRLVITAVENGCVGISGVSSFALNVDEEADTAGWKMRMHEIARRINPLQEPHAGLRKLLLTYSEPSRS